MDSGIGVEHVVLFEEVSDFTDDCCLESLGPLSTYLKPMVGLHASPRA